MQKYVFFTVVKMQITYQAVNDWFTGLWRRGLRSNERGSTENVHHLHYIGGGALFTSPIVMGVYFRRFFSQENAGYSGYFSWVPTSPDATL